MRGLKRHLSATLMILISFQLVSCGTLLYPERRDQKSGQVDVAVVLMDGIGLFFFIIPGVIAFAVDFTTGAIYLPHSGSHSRRYRQAQDRVPKDLSYMVKVDPGKLNPDAIVRAVAENTGYHIRLDDTRLIVIKAQEQVDIDRELLKLMVEPGKTSHPPFLGTKYEAPKEIAGFTNGQSGKPSFRLSSFLEPARS